MSEYIPSNYPHYESDWQFESYKEQNVYLAEACQYLQNQLNKKELHNDMMRSALVSCREEFERCLYLDDSAILTEVNNAIKGVA